MLALGKDPNDGGQTWLASEVGMAPQGIQSILAGDSKRPRKLKEIAFALQTTEDFLLGKGRHASAQKTPTPEMAIRLAKLFAELMEHPSSDLQYQVAGYIESRLLTYRAQSRETDTNAAS
jgi:hypothetical protein